MSEYEFKVNGLMRMKRWKSYVISFTVNVSQSSRKTMGDFELMC